MTNDDMWETDIIKYEANCTDPRLTLEQNWKVKFLIEEYHNAFGLRHEMGTLPYVVVHLKIHDEAPFLFTHVIKEQQKAAIQ